MGAAKIFYAPLPHEEPSLASADFEWHILQRLDSAAAHVNSPFRPHVAQYLNRVELGNGRVSLFMSAYTRSFHNLLEESHTSVPLPGPFVLRTARDVLQGLVLQGLVLLHSGQHHVQRRRLRDAH